MVGMAPYLEMRVWVDDVLVKVDRLSDPDAVDEAVLDHWGYCVQASREGRQWMIEAVDPEGHLPAVQFGTAVGGSEAMAMTPGNVERLLAWLHAGG